MKVGKWRIEFKTTITNKYKNVKEVPFWRVYVVRREPVLNADLDEKTGELLRIHDDKPLFSKRMIKYHRAIVSMTYDEVINQFKDMDVLTIGGVKLDPTAGFYVVAYPRKTYQTRV